MLGRTHVTGGMISACASLLLFNQSVQFLPPPVMLLTMGAGMFGSLLPDIDHPQSSLGRQLPIVSDGVSLVMGHRGGMHSTVAAFLAGAAAALGMRFIHLSPRYLPSDYILVVAFVFGYLSHLALDALTPSGVPFLWPFNEQRFALPLTHTGSLIETCLVFPFLLLVFAFLALRILPVTNNLFSNVSFISVFWKAAMKIYSIFAEVFKDVCAQLFR